MKNQQKIKWRAIDYFRTISLFVLLTLIIVGLTFVALTVEVGGTGNRGDFLSGSKELSEKIYIILALAFVFALTYIYFYTEMRDFLYKTSNIFMFFTVMTVSMAACWLFGKINPYLRPFALCALLMLLLVGRRAALFLNCAFCICMLLLDLFVRTSPDYDRVIYTSLIINFISGIFAVFMIDGEGSRAKVLGHSVFIAIPVIVSAVCLEFTTSVSELDSEGLRALGRTALFAFGSGVLSDGIMMLLLPFFEIAFGAVTNFRLAELTDHKARLIKCLIALAPGTFNHTTIVAMLAEACSNAIGENPLLARACAYYHDIGKIKKPEYFTENQTGVNPHDELSPELSTEIIRSHAKDGAELIRKWRLPEVLADAAEQHHGTMPIRYFYAKALKYTDGELNMDNFCYAGPKPQTKINAIIMICDACEAKVRSIGTRSHENVDKAVKEIIEERMDAEQFSDCDITFRELDIIRNTITNSLAGVYHDRVKYPKLKSGSKK